MCAWFYMKYCHVPSQIKHCLRWMLSAFLLLRAGQISSVCLPHSRSRPKVCTQIYINVYGSCDWSILWSSILRFQSRLTWGMRLRHEDCGSIAQLLSHSLLTAQLDNCLKGCPIQWPQPVWHCAATQILPCTFAWQTMHPTFDLYILRLNYN